MTAVVAHFVTEQLDQGPVILQDVFHIRVGEDTLEGIILQVNDLDREPVENPVVRCLREGRAEVQKCAWACEFYAEHGARMLADETLEEIEINPILVRAQGAVAVDALIEVGLAKRGEAPRLRAGAVGSLGGP